ncbi:MAG TPA: hypothetical protein VM536_06660 [Chloroflexia bacterium]|nr:hypothetical protein [Chloroflexia bacterium]
MRRRRYSRDSSRRSGRGAARLVSNPLIVVAVLLFVVGLLGTVVEVSTLRVPQTIGIWSLICSNALLIIGAFSREM